MIRHCVFLGLVEDFDEAELEEVIVGLADLVSRMPGAGAMVAGPNRDFEDKTGAYPFGFTMDFDSPDALAAYAENPDHKALGARLVALCGGADRIAVFDLEFPE